MKKIIMITAMFMATSVWSADYKICSFTKAYETVLCVKGELLRGYKPHGSLSVTFSTVNHGRGGTIQHYVYSQALYKAN